jgi:hypothetical protein
MPGSTGIMGRKVAVLVANGVAADSAVHDQLRSG